MANEHYKNEEEFVFAIADAMHEEYQAIVDAGFQLQIDDPDLPDGWNCLPDMSVAGISQIRDAARRRAQPRAQAAFRKRKSGCMCAGAASTARITTTFRLKDIADIIFQVNAGSYSIEASNPVPRA